MRTIKNIHFCRDIHSYPLEEELLLFNSRSKQVVLLNKTAALIWKGIEEGCPANEITCALAQSTGNAVEEIDRDISSVELSASRS